MVWNHNGHLIRRGKIKHKKEKKFVPSTYYTTMTWHITNSLYSVLESMKSKGKHHKMISTESEYQ